MRLSILALLSLIPAGFPAESRAASYAWEAMLPTEGKRPSLVEFSGAIEAGNGDILVAGQDMHGEYLARLRPDGKVRWLGQSAYPAGAGSTYIGIHETSRGIVTLWGCCGEPGWTAVLYGDTGGVAGRLDLGYPRGSLDVTPGARVVFLSSELGQGPTMISAEGRGLTDGIAWKTPMVRARLDEVVGIHAVGDSSIAVLDRTGGSSGDTLMATLLDGSGRSLWTRQVPSGAMADGYPDNPSVRWNKITCDPSGRIVLAGLAALSADSTVPASMAIAVMTSGGSLLWFKRFPLGLPGPTSSTGSWSILSLTAGSQGIRVCLSHGGPEYWFTRDIPWSGESDGTFFSTPPVDVPSMYMSCLMTPGGNYIGFGSTSPDGGIVAHAPQDPSWSAAGIAYPVLFGAVPDSGKNWRARRLTEYGDTVWVQTQPSAGSPTGGILLQQTAGPGLYFLLPTKDGGAVTGGRLWRRNGEDTLSVIAIKIPPEEIDALPIRSVVIGRRAPEIKGPLPFDAAGRLRRKDHGPIYRYRP